MDELPEGFLDLARAHHASLTSQLAQQLRLLTAATLQAALAKFIDDGTHLSHVRRMTRLYREHRDCLIQALREEAGQSLAIDVPAGGIQLLARYKGRTDEGPCRAGFAEPASSRGPRARCSIMPHGSADFFWDLPHGRMPSWCQGEADRPLHAD